MKYSKKWSIFRDLRIENRRLNPLKLGLYYDFKKNPETYSIYKISKAFHNEAGLFVNNLINDGNSKYLVEGIYKPIFSNTKEVCFLFNEGFWIVLQIHMIKDKINSISLIGRDSKILTETDKEDIFNFMAYIAFIEKSTIKTKIIKSRPNSRSFHCRHERQNDTGLDINLCDINWYTESLQNHPFVVRGHWRNQACGVDMKDRKLKWIDTHMKTGYTKGAYKEKV